jgi:uncharacterized membrane protein YccC
VAAAPSEPSLPSRAIEALDALRPSVGIRDRFRRVRLTALPIVQAALAAALAWWAATSPPVDHERPFFAPIAALIAVGVGLGQRLRRVIELVAGVALGVLVGDLLVGVIGTGAPQIAAVVALAMIAAIFLGGGAVIVTQAAGSAVLVVTLVPSSDDGAVNLDRFVDATIGGVVGLAVTVLLLPVNPVSAARRELDPLLDTLAELLDGSADALAERDRAPLVLPPALRTLAGAVRMLQMDLAAAAEPTEARSSAVAAAELSTEALDQTGGFAGQVVVAQTRSMAVDLLRATGLDRDDAQRLMPSLPPGPVSYG